MSSYTFPTLSTPPISIRGGRSSVKAEYTFENGFTQCIGLFSTTPRYWEVEYKYLSIADIEILRLFEIIVRDIEEFTWVNPDDNQSYTVRFDENRNKKRIEIEPNSYNTLATTFRLNEALS